MHRICCNILIIIFSFNYLDNEISKLLLFLDRADKIINAAFYEKYYLSIYCYRYAILRLLFRNIIKRFVIEHSEMHMQKSHSTW